MKSDPFQAPADGEDALLNFIVRVRQLPATGTDQASQTAHQKKVHQAVLSAAEKLLALPLKGARMLWVLRAKGIALRHLSRLGGAGGDAQAVRQYQEYMASLRKDPRPLVAAEGELLDLNERSSNVAKLAPVDQDRLVRDVDGFFERASVDQSHFSLASSLCQSIQSTNPGLAGFACEELAQHFLKHTDATIAREAEKLYGTGVRMRLVGRPLAISGTTVAGQTFDLKTYKGKVVLVKFWASWCSNCVAELPEIQKTYNDFHARGFEVVGVTLDKDSQTAQRFVTDRRVPWPNLISTDPKRKGWDDPRVIRLGISSLPSAILVDQNGKVVSADARGDELNRLVAGLLSKTADSATGD